MLSPALLRAWHESLEEMSYYAILKVDEAASGDEVKAAFHEFALKCHPDRYVEFTAEAAAAAAEVFKRGVEAYRVLSRPDQRAKYDDALRAGKLRIDEHAVAEQKAKAVPKTLEAIAATPEAKAHARKADRLASIGNFEQARLELASAIQCDPFNDELKIAMTRIYEAIAKKG